MSSCNAQPVSWAIRPTMIGGCARKRSCNATASSWAAGCGLSAGCGFEISCNARDLFGPLRRQYPGCACRQACTRGSASNRHSIFAQPAPLAGMLAGVGRNPGPNSIADDRQSAGQEEKPAAMAALTPRGENGLATRRACKEYRPKETQKKDSKEARGPLKEEEIVRSVQENAPEENRIFRPLVLHHFHSAADKRSSFPLLCG